MATAQRFTDFDGLINRGTSDFLRTSNELTTAKNAYCYQLGKLEKVPGYSVAGANSQVVDNNSVRFLHFYQKATSGDKYLLAFSDNTTALNLRYIAPNLSSPVTSWTTINVGTSYDALATAQPDCVNYLDKVFIVGHKSGTTFLPNATLDATTFTTSTSSDDDLLSMPQGKYIEKYRDLIYVLNAYENSVARPNRAYYCDDPVYGGITWTPATKFLEFGYNDGDEITGAKECNDRLIVFKHFSMWKWDESDLKETASIGCDSYRSIIKIKNVLYWFNREGFWRWTGDYPQLISSKIQDFVDAIDQTTISNIVAVNHDFEYRAFVGNITVDGYTYTNAWLCFDIRREKWYIRCTYHVAKSCCYFLENSIKRAYFGNDDGYVYKFNTKVDKIYRDGYYDAANPGYEIDSFFVTGAIDHGYPEDLKFTTNITTFSKGASKMKIAVDVDDKKEFKEANPATLENNFCEHEISATGHIYKYKFYEKSGDKSWEFLGFVTKTELKEED